MVINVIIIGLAAYYLAYALCYTSGPGNLFYKARKIKWLPLGCFTCTAVWTAAVVALALYAGLTFLVTFLAAAGVAVLVDMWATS